MRILTLIADKSGSLGSVVAAMGCASCFPALGALGASVGLGFLAQFEGVFINTLLPIFAGIALAANLISCAPSTGRCTTNVWRRLSQLPGQADESGVPK